MSGREIENEPWGGQPAPFLVLVSLLALVGFHDSWARFSTLAVSTVGKGMQGSTRVVIPGPLNTRSVDCRTRPRVAEPTAKSQGWRIHEMTKDGPTFDGPIN
jgi:hypothetical protein